MRPLPQRLLLLTLLLALLHCRTDAAEGSPAAQASRPITPAWTCWVVVF
jgi:hypothetical protein